MAKPDRLAIVLRVGVYAFLVIITMMILPLFVYPIAGPLITASLCSFAAAAIGNAIVLRIYENGQLADIGMAWNRASRRNLLIGVASGIGCGLAVTLGPVILRSADIVQVPGAKFEPGSLLFVSIILLFGAVGEEMLFRGYAFQLLMAYLGEWATILPFGILFAFAHLNNPNQNNLLGPLNTALWGIILGYAFLRSGDLWLPIGIHFGWNWTLPLFGVNLSGFTMGVTGLSMRWHMGDLWSGGQYGPEGGLLSTVILVGLAYVLHRAPIDRQTPFLVRRAQAQP
jgi:hypothetical protein